MEDILGWHASMQMKLTGLYRFAISCRIEYPPQRRYHPHYGRSSCGHLPQWKHSFFLHVLLLSCMDVRMGGILDWKTLRAKIICNSLVSSNGQSQRIEKLHLYYEKYGIWTFIAGGLFLGRSQCTVPNLRARKNAFLRFVDVMGLQSSFQLRGFSDWVTNLRNTTILSLPL